MSTDPKWHGYTDQHVRARVSMCANSELVLTLKLTNITSHRTGQIWIKHTWDKHQQRQV